MDEVEYFICLFPNLWVLRVSGNPFWGGGGQGGQAHFEEAASSLPQDTEATLFRVKNTHSANLFLTD
jgi:hypothetical protein